MKKISVSLKDRSYTIQFGSYKTGLLPALTSLGLKPRSVFIVTTRAVEKAGYPRLLASRLRQKGFKPTVASLPNGEAHKTLTTLHRLYSLGLKAGLDRKSLVIGLGGGVVTDLAGFFAATYMRGLDYVSVPTTLLGMVDAAIGGKTGVDLKEGKNLVGAFWQPRLVWVDLSVLATLPTREWKTGFAEIVKYGVILSRPFFRWLQNQLKQNCDIQTWPSRSLHRAVYESARMKARVVSRDEKETPLGGGREILNFGHTMGHALEAATVYGSLTHGEAISIGMVGASTLALQHKMWSLDEQLELVSMFDVLGLPVRMPRLQKREKDRFWSALQKDKKQIAGKLRFVLPQKIGRVVVRSGIARAEVKRALAQIGF